MKLLSRSLAWTSALLLMSSLDRANALIINLNFDPSMDAQAQAGFQRAANIWEGLIGDNFELNLDVDFRSLSPGVLGQASSSAQVSSYSDVRAALLGNTTSADDSLATANLQSGSSLVYRTNSHVDGSLILDSDGGNNNSFLAVNTANAKALGLRSATDAGSDASITFNSDFNWDFDQSDGVGAGLQDFVGVTVHEIGHALGFTSGVDAVDSTYGGASNDGFDLSNNAVFSIWDLFRYGDRTGAGPELDFSSGGPSYFSIDGGATNLGLFSTGSENGDGQQASHWKDNMNLGLLDPTARPAGQVNTLSALDLRAFDVMGFTIIPEPSSIAVLSLFVCVAMGIRRRP